MYPRYIKRLLDIIIALVALLLFWWVYAILALLVRAKLGSPVIFRQQRPGMRDPRTGEERIFDLYKFRTMTDERGEDGELLPDEVRLTPFGRRLRSTSLDELPELFNILRGDMSLIGPRPLLVRYLPRYTEEQRHRHDVRPGLTGLAQVSGRNAITWEAKFEYDVYYARNCSFSLDLRIFLETFRVILAREGISSDTSATMEEFMGTGAQAESISERMQA